MDHSPSVLVSVASHRHSTESGRWRRGFRLLVVLGLAATSFGVSLLGAGAANAVTSASGVHASVTAAPTLTNDAGTIAAPSWHAPVPADPTSGDPQDVSCPSTTFCAAVDRGGSVELYDGRTVSAPQRIDPGVYGIGSGYLPLSLVTISCTSANFCVAADITGAALSYNGRTWTRNATTHLGQFGGPLLSCVSSTFCLGVDQDGTTSRFNAGTWTQQASIGDSSTFPVAITALSCTSATFCLATDLLNAVTYRYDGTTWTAVSGSTAPELVSCVSPTSCVGVSSSTAYRFNGTTWSAGSAVPGFGAAVTLDCVSSTFCVVADGNGRFSRYNGTSWTPAATFDTDPHRGDKLSCASTTMCADVNSAGQARRFNGSSWSAPLQVDPVRGDVATSLSCRSATFCAAVDQGGFATTYHGTRWSPAVAVTPGHAAQSVSCASTTFCVLVGTGGVASRFNGTSWSAPVVFDSAAPDAAAVSCASSTMCVAVDSSGRASRFNGTSWSTPVAVGPSGTALRAVSCPTSTFCVAVEGLHVRAFTYNGSTWSGPHSFSGIGGFTGSRAPERRSASPPTSPARSCATTAARGVHRRQLTPPETARGMSRVRRRRRASWRTSGARPRCSTAPAGRHRRASTHTRTRGPTWLLSAALRPATAPCCPTTGSSSRATDPPCTVMTPRASTTGGGRRHFLIPADLSDECVSLGRSRVGRARLDRSQRQRRGC